MKKFIRFLLIGGIAVFVFGVTGSALGLTTGLILTSLLVGFIVYSMNSGGKDTGIKYSEESKTKTDRVDTIYKYPELKDLEMKIKKAVSQKKSLSFDLPDNLIDKEKWEYLKGKYPFLKPPITSELHNLHNIYKQKFESLKERIQEGKVLCLDEFEENNLRPFVMKYLPDSQLNIVRPELIRTNIAGLKYHDYKKKEVKEMLQYGSREILDLEPEPDNKYDTYAVKLMWEGYFIGYVPRSENYEVASAIAEGNTVKCILTDYYTSGPLEERARIEIRIDKF